ncbi:MAG: hypothetical protein NVS3B20_02610 [Polyangiales bacterium]
MYGGRVDPSVTGSDLASIQDALSKGEAAHFLDVSGGALGTGDVDRIQKRIAAFQAQTGAKVFVVAIPPKIDTELYRPLYKDLQMKGKDLLIVFNGERRHLHCEAITKKGGVEILKKTKEEFYKSNSAGLVSMLDAASTRMSNTSALATASSARKSRQAVVGGDGTLLVLGVGALAAMSWIFFRRRKQEATLSLRVKAALEGAETTLHDVHRALERDVAATAPQHPAPNADEVRGVSVGELPHAAGDGGAPSPQSERHADFSAQAAALKSRIAVVRAMPMGAPALSKAIAVQDDVRTLKQKIALSQGTRAPAAAEVEPPPPLHGAIG